MPGWDKIHYNRTIGSTSMPPDPVVLMAVWWWWNEVLSPDELLRAVEELGPGMFASDFSDASIGRLISEHLHLEKRCRADLEANPVWSWVVSFPDVRHYYKNWDLVPQALRSLSSSWLKSHPWWASNLAEMTRIKAKNKKVQDVLKA